jgi:hypothetical protein
MAGEEHVGTEVAFLTNDAAAVELVVGYESRRGGRVHPAFLVADDVVMSGLPGGAC